MREGRRDFAAGRSSRHRSGPGAGRPAGRRDPGRHGRRRDQDREARRRRRRPHLGPALRAGRRDLALFLSARTATSARSCSTSSSPADIETLHRLCETADILIQNLRPGVVDEIGIGPEAMLARHPRLIYCSIWAFGYQGPLRHEAGLRSAAAGLWRHDERHRPAGGSADLLRRLDQRQGDRHVLHHRRAGGAAAARQDRQGLPGRHLAVRFGGALGRGAGQQLPRERRRAASATAPAAT